jgi:peptide/nickel transport system permease protein
MRSYLIKRLLLGILTVYGVATLVFFLMRIVPGDPARIALSEPGREGKVPEELVRAMRVKLGLARATVLPNKALLEPKYGEKYAQVVTALRRLDPQTVMGSVKAGAPVNAGGYILLPKELQVEIADIPLHQQYWEWLWNSVRLDFGNSLKVNRPVTEEWLRFFPVTFNVAMLAGIMTVFTAVPLGVISAIRQDRVWDYVGRVIAIAGLSLPSFWVALLIILMLLIWFKWLPPLEYVPFWEEPLQSLKQIAFPAFAVAFAQIGVIARMTRSSMLEVLREDYIRAAWAKGLGERRVVLHHALKNAFLPVLTVFGLQLGFSIGGLVVVERAFNLPGLGNFLADSVVFRDYNAIQATLFATAIFVTAANLLVDLAYGWFNPKIRYQ